MSVTTVPIRLCSKVFHLISCITDVTLSGLSGLYGLFLRILLRCVALALSVTVVFSVGIPYKCWILAFRSN